jgi:hypothetical protein
MAAYGANVATDSPLSPIHESHDHHAYYQWLTGPNTGEHVRFETSSVLPF